MLAGLLLAVSGCAGPAAADPPAAQSSQSSQATQATQASQGSQGAQPSGAAQTADAGGTPSKDAAAPPAAGGTPLVVASDLDNRPFAWVDEAGRPQGRDVEMMEAIGRLLHRPVAWKRMAFADLLPAAEAGSVDVVCATLGITPERAEVVDFSRPYFVTELSIVTRNAPEAPARLPQLAGLRVAAGAGTTSERAVRQQLPDAVGVFRNEAGASSADRIASGIVDALVMDRPAAVALVATDPARLRLMDDTLGEERYALVVRRGRTDLLSALDGALLQLEQAGSLSRLDGKFGLAVATAPGR